MTVAAEITALCSKRRNGIQMMGQSWYYVEKWDQNGTRAKWFEKLPSLVSVRSLIEDVRQANTGEIVRVIPHDASAEELKALRKLVRPSWIHVVDHNTDRQSGNETACCNKLQRICELRDHSISLHSPNAWFQHGDTKLENPRYFYIERDLQGLDDEAWAFLKGEALPRLIAKDPSQSRGWQQLFDTLNEAKGYNHLVQIGCADVKFIPRSTTNKIRTPDLRGLLSSTMVLCEVKTVNVSKIEADRINEGGVGTTQAYLDAGFFNKLLSDLQTASSQMLAFSTEVGTRRIAYIVVNFDDRLHECADEYEDQIVAYLTGVSMPGVEVVLDIKPAFSVK